MQIHSSFIYFLTIASEKHLKHIQTHMQEKKEEIRLKTGWVAGCLDCWMGSRKLQMKAAQHLREKKTSTDMLEGICCCSYTSCLRFLHIFLCLYLKKGIVHRDASSEWCFPYAGTTCSLLPTPNGQPTNSNWRWWLPRTTFSFRYCISCCLFFFCVLKRFKRVFSPFNHDRMYVLRSCWGPGRLHPPNTQSTTNNS